MEIFDGATGHDKPNDWTASDIGEDIRTMNIEVLSDPKTTLNQGNHAATKSSCTISWAYRQVCQLFNLEANDEEMLKIANRCNKHLWWDFKWQYSSDWANMMAKYWNTHNPDKKVFFIKVEYDNPDFDWIQNKKNFMVWSTYRGNSLYGQDFRKDGVLDWTSFYPSTYGHRTNIRKEYVEDQYYNGSCNRYKLGRDKYTLKELVENGVYYPTMYIFLKESYTNENSIDDMKEAKKIKNLATIFTNGMSLFWPYLNETDKKTVATLAEKTRYMHDIKKHSDEKNKLAAVLISSAKEAMKSIPEENRKELANAIMKLSLDE